MVRIDAICIDPGDKDERFNQIRQIDMIYSNAKDVVAWLGPGYIYLKDIV